MKVKFINPSGNLPENLTKLGWFPSSELHLKTEVDYEVYSVSYWKSVVYYLIIRSGLTLPDWMPAYFFEIIDPRLPSEWYFRYLGDNHSNGLEIEMGYKEMVLDENHSDDLIERDVKAIQIFLKRKKEIEESEL